MKILVAEDDNLIRSALEFRLKKDNHDVTLAIDGKDALKKIDEQIPDLVITDIMMPHISGLELVGLIKEKYQNQIKIIVLTTMGQEDVVLEAFGLGADDFIPKPFSPNELSVRIKRFAIKKI
ncbi:DNA-binding response OmpR family regulator [Wenyingzhuangia heitensis]|uniref:DNA-binding response OmpR family regulator n=1 Tax=Wenyingzhuangia heitensis TaxID=1487859 RepID=A0ABX0UD17_9FLAO|nr:response regulator transcription factor [Wenyingzhuangia heitensis]NIJ45715.1 DNA-binding response OmpR family regulator [Wenyingzhuangia heitensis]